MDPKVDVAHPPATCCNCCEEISLHCEVHVVPCCPGKCPGPNDFSILEDTQHASGAETVVFVAFKIEMKDRQYGREALTAAWEWFKAGFDHGFELGVVDENGAVFSGGEPPGATPETVWDEDDDYEGDDDDDEDEGRGRGPKN